MSDWVDDFDDDVTVPAVPSKSPTEVQPVDDFSDDATVAFTPRQDAGAEQRQARAAASASAAPRAVIAPNPSSTMPRPNLQPAQPSPGLRPSPTAGQAWTPPRQPTAPPQAVNVQSGSRWLIVGAGVAALLIVAIVVWFFALRGEGDASPAAAAMTLLWAVE